MRTVNFIEAVNSGKRFKCREWYGGKSFSANENNEVEFKDGAKNVFVPVEFFNSQFEIEEKEITITESQLDEAWSLINIGTQFRDNFKKEIGF